MNRKNESVTVANTLLKQASQLQWSREQIEMRTTTLALSSSVTLHFITRVLDCLDGNKFKILSISAGLKTIVDHAGGISGFVRQSVQPPAYEQVEWTDLHRGRTLYIVVPEKISTAAIDGFLPPWGSKTDLSHIVLLTTETVDPTVHEYASAVYRRTGGIEVTVLDCLGFLRHFLQLFHQHRGTFLNIYQSLVLTEPDSAVAFVHKHLFLSLLFVATAPPPDES